MCERAVTLKQAQRCSSPKALQLVGRIGIQLKEIKCFQFKRFSGFQVMCKKGFQCKRVLFFRKQVGHPKLVIPTKVGQLKLFTPSGSPQLGSPKFGHSNPSG